MSLWRSYEQRRLVGSRGKTMNTSYVKIRNKDSNV